MSKTKNSQINFTVPHKAVSKVSASQHYEATDWVDSRDIYVTQNVHFEHNATYADGAADHTTPYGYTMYAVRVDYGEYDFVVPGYGSYHYTGTTDSRTSQGPADYSKWGLVPAGSFWLPDVPTSLVNQVIAEAKNKLSGSNFNLGTSLAEARDALKTMADLLTNLAALVGKIAEKIPKTTVVRRDTSLVFRDGSVVTFGTNRRNAKKLSPRRLQDLPKGKLREIPKGSRWVHPDGVVDAAEKAWLNALYGFLPLWLDFQGLCQTAGSALRKNGAHITVQRNIMKSGDLPSFSRAYYAGGFSADGKYQFGAECKLHYRLNDAYAQYIAGLGLLDPFAVFWELSPYSFVIDWLLPIGTWLQATLDSEVGVSFLSGYSNKKSFCDFEVESCWYSGHRGKIPNLHIRNVAQVRDPYYTSPFVGLYVKSPFSVSHAATAIALVAQRLRGSHRRY